MVSPTELTTAVKTALPTFRGYAQQDSQEFLRCFMDRLHEEMKEPRPAARRSRDPEDLDGTSCGEGSPEAEEEESEGFESEEEEEEEEDEEDEEEGGGRRGEASLEEESTDENGEVTTSVRLCWRWRLVLNIRFFRTLRGGRPRETARRRSRSLQWMPRTDSPIPPPGTTRLSAGRQRP